MPVGANPHEASDERRGLRRFSVRVCLVVLSGSHTPPPPCPHDASSPSAHSRSTAWKEEPGGSARRTHTVLCLDGEASGDSEEGKIEVK